MRSWRLQRVPTATAATLLATRIVAIVLALIAAAIALAIKGTDPLQLAATVIETVFGSAFGLEDLTLLFIPLAATGLAVAIGIRIGIWNIGAEGQFCVGALSAAAVGLFVEGPGALPLAVVAGMAGGMLWIAVPAWARCHLGVSELITTLLLNFVGILLVYYVATGPWRDLASITMASTARIPIELPRIFGGVHAGVLGIVLLAGVCAAAFAFTRWGYEVSFAGSNPDAAAYAGIAVRRRIMEVMLISGAIAGLAGTFEVLGTVHRLQGGMSNNFGYLGIIVAVLARGSSLGVMLSAVFIAILLNSGIVAQASGISTSAVLAVTGVILMMVAVGESLAHYRLVRIKFPQA